MSESEPIDGILNKLSNFIIMIVSNFELLIKRIATVPPSTPASISNVFRRVVQGYFLTVSNLESNRSISLFLNLKITRSTGNRELNNSNTQVVFDNGNTNNVSLSLTRLSSSNANTTQYRTGIFTLQPGQTGLIAVLPNVIPFIGTTNPDLEVRGIVEIRQRRRITFPFPITTPAADIMTTPEIRGTFLDNDYPTPSTTNELDFDQIAYGLPNASGKAQNIVERVPPFIIRPDIAEDLDFELPKLEKIIKEDNPDITDDEFASISDSLMAMRDSKTDFKKIMRELNKGQGK